MAKSDSGHGDGCLLLVDLPLAVGFVTYSGATMLGIAEGPGQAIARWAVYAAFAIGVVLILRRIARFILSHTRPLE